MKTGGLSLSWSSRGAPAPPSTSDLPATDLLKANLRVPDAQQCAKAKNQRVVPAQLFAFFLGISSEDSYHNTLYIYITKNYDTHIIKVVIPLAWRKKMYTPKLGAVWHPLGSKRGPGCELGCRFGALFRVLVWGRALE